MIDQRKTRQLNVYNEVLVLLPISHNKLIMEWKALYSVVGTKNNGVNYLIKARGKTKLFHINMLKKYFSRDPMTFKPDKVQLYIVEDNHSDVTVNTNNHGWNIYNNLS